MEMIVVGDQVKVESRNFHDNIHPLLVDCVLQNCFKYLSVKTISSCRLVSKFWNQSACSTLRQRSCVKFKFAEEIYGFTKLMESCDDCPFRKYVFHIFDHEIEHQLVQSLFDKFGDTMTSITFELQGNSRYAYNPPRPKAFKQLLLSPPHLEELKLYGLSDNILRAENLFDPTTNPFKDLKSLSVSISQDVWMTHHGRGGGGGGGDGESDDDDDDSANVKSSRALIFNILNCSKNLKSLKIGVVKCLTQILQSVNLSLLLRNLEQFVSIPGKASAVDSEEIFLLGEACPNLKYLNLFVDPSSVSSSEIYDMLSKMKKLKYLCIRGGPALRLEFPCMKNLMDICVRQAKFPLDQLVTSLPRVQSAQISIHPLDCRPSSSAEEQENDHDHDNVNVCPPRSGLVSLHVCRETNDKDLSFTHFLSSVKSKFPFISRLRILVNTNDQMQVIYKLTHLQDLYIEDGSDISDREVTGLSYHDLFNWWEGRVTKSEHELRLTRTSAYIGNLQRLKYLYLGSVKITNASIVFGLVDVPELTRLSLKEPQYRMSQEGQNLKLSKNGQYAFKLGILACSLTRLTRIELIETCSREDRLSHRPTIIVGITHEEISAVKKCQPHFQLVYITCTPTGQKRFIYC